MEMRQARMEELPEILFFLKQYFPLRKRYFENAENYVREFEKNGKLCTWIAKQEDELLAICSYMLLNEAEHPDILSGIWCAKPDANALIGLQLRKEMLQALQPRLFAGVTSIPSSLPSHRRFTKEIEVFEEYQMEADSSRQSHFRQIKTGEEAGEIPAQEKNGLIKDLEYLFRHYLDFQEEFRLFELDNSEKIWLIVRMKEDVLELVDAIGQDAYLQEALEELPYLAGETAKKRVLFPARGKDVEIANQAGYQPVLEEERSYPNLRYGFANAPIRMRIGDGIWE